MSRHRLVSSFMRGVKRLRPVRPPSFTSWDPSVVLMGLMEPPFEPLESVPKKILMLKVSLILLVLVSLKCLGDLQTLSVRESCIEFSSWAGQGILEAQTCLCPKRCCRLSLLPLQMRTVIFICSALSGL